MARTLVLLIALLLPIRGWAQSAQLPVWDISFGVGTFEGRPGDNNTAYQDNWFFHGRYAVSIDRYWTEHLKTEVEYARSGEGSVYLQEFKAVDGQVYPYGVQSFHQYDQLSARMVWQFGHNAWVHPYLSAGVVAERDRRHLHVPAQYQFVNGRATMVTPDTNTNPTVNYRAGATASAGAKLYLSRRAFFNTGIVGTWSQPSITLSLLAGLGFDF